MGIESLGGAFDLSTLKQPEQQNAEPSVPGPYELEVRTADLEAVVQTSMHLPVVLVFHSLTSENSAKLVATMSQLAAQYAGRIQVGKVAIEEGREIVTAFGITGIPAAAALLQGQPVPLFQGLPERQQLVEAIDKLLAAASQYGLNGILDGDAAGIPPEPEVPPLHKEGLEALEKGDLAAAHTAYSKALKENPRDSEALTALRQVELLQRVSALNPSGEVAVVEKILVDSRDVAMHNVEVHLTAADIEFSYGRADAAFARLIEVVRQTSGDDRETVRKRLLELFDIIGQHNDLVVQARKALTNALF